MIYLRTYNDRDVSSIRTLLPKSVISFLDSSIKYSIEDEKIIFSKSGEYIPRIKIYSGKLNLFLDKDMYEVLKNDNRSIKIKYDGNKMTIGKWGKNKELNSFYELLENNDYKINNIEILELIDRVRYTNKKKGFKNIVRCKCYCGNIFITNLTSLNNKEVKSCGCLKREFSRENMKKVNKIGTIELEKARVEKTNLAIISSKKARSNTGYRGVSYSGGYYHAQITFQGVHYSLGIYKNLDEAIESRKKAEEKFFKPILKKYNYNTDE